MLSGIIYFLPCLGLFLIYFIVFTIFGNIFLNLFGNNHEKRISLEEALKSFAIGTALHLSISTLTISFEIFSFYITFLPFILIDLVFIIFLVYRNRKELRKRLKNLNKEGFIKKLRANYKFLIIILFAIVLQFSLQLYFLNYALTYPEKDPYAWFYYIMYTIENGHIDLVGGIMSIYPPGYILFISTPLSVVNDYYVMFFFMKYIPVFLCLINMLVIYVIARKNFNEKIYILLTLTIFLSFHYFMSRFLENIPSILATTFGYLFLLFMDESIIGKIDKDNSKILKFTKKTFIDKNLIFRGLILAGIGMANPIYILFFMAAYFSYELFLLLKYIKENGYFSKANLYKIVRFFIVILSIFLFAFISILPYFYYVERLFHVDNVFIANFKKYATYPLSFGSINTFFSDFIFVLSGFSNFYWRTLGIGIFIVIIGLFIHRKKTNIPEEDKNYLINFVKYTFLFTFAFYVFIEVLGAIGPPSVQWIYDFYWIYRQRLFELFGGFWSLIFVIGFIYILRFFFNSFNKRKKNVDYSQEKMKKSMKAAFFGIILLTGGYFYLNNYYNIYYSYWVNDDQKVEVLLFAGNYFNENPLDEETWILLEDVEEGPIDALISYIPYLNFKYFDYLSNNSYSNFTDFYDNMTCKFSIIPKLEVDENFLNNLRLDFEFLYENRNYLFAMK